MLDMTVLEEKEGKIGILNPQKEVDHRNYIRIR